MKQSASSEMTYNIIWLLSWRRMAKWLAKADLTLFAAANSMPVGSL